MFYNARYYNPQTGIFIQADSVDDGQNKYQYVASNPVNLTDPTGNCPFCFGALFKVFQDLTKQDDCVLESEDKCIDDSSRSEDFVSYTPLVLVQAMQRILTGTDVNLKMFISNNLFHEYKLLARLGGMEYAPALMEHFLSGSGEPVYINDPSHFLEESRSAFGEILSDQIKDRFSDLEVNESMNIELSNERLVSQFEIGSDGFFSLGRFTVEVSGNVKVTREKKNKYNTSLDSITIDYSGLKLNDIYDFYDWDSEMSFTQSWGAGLDEAGLAKNFEIHLNPENKQYVFPQGSSHIEICALGSLKFRDCK